MITAVSLLKKATTHLHHQLEQVSYANEIMTQKILAPQYLDLILKNYLIYQELEPQINLALKNLSKDFSETFYSQRLQDLKKDLALLAHPLSIKTPPLLPFQMSSPNPIAWIGVLYVLEGSRLGGKAIVNALKKNTHLQHISNFHFYQQKDIDTRKRWMTFMTLANELMDTSDNIALAQTSANETFEYFYQAHKQALLKDFPTK